MEYTIEYYPHHHGKKHWIANSTIERGGLVFKFSTCKYNGIFDTKVTIYKGKENITGKFLRQLNFSHGGSTIATKKNVVKAHESVLKMSDEFINDLLEKKELWGAE